MIKIKEETYAMEQKMEEVKVSDRWTAKNICIPPFFTWSNP